MKYPILYLDIICSYNWFPSWTTLLRGHYLDLFVFSVIVNRKQTSFTYHFSGHKKSTFISVYFRAATIWSFIWTASSLVGVKINAHNFCAGAGLSRCIPRLTTRTQPTPSLFMFSWSLSCSLLSSATSASVKFSSLIIIT